MNLSVEKKQVTRRQGSSPSEPAHLKRSLLKEPCGGHVLIGKPALLSFLENAPSSALSTLV